MSASALPLARSKRPYRLRPARVGVYAFLLTAALFFLLPLYIVLITSTKDLQEIATGNIFVPSAHPSLAPWYRAWFEICTGLECKGISPNFWNSVIITVPSVVVSIAVAITSARVSRPRTTSSSRMTLAGEKKCSPITSPGRPVACAMASISR